MPFQSQAQAGWAFANKKPFAKRWARQTGPYKRLPYKKRKKSYTLDQLEAFVSSPHYDPITAGLIAAHVPTLPRLKGEQISPGVTRIRGNLCNVHGRYGPCDKALSGKKPKGGARKPRKVPQTPAQRAQARQQQRQTNTDSVAKRMADTDTGLSPSGSKALAAFAQGQQPDATMGAGLAQMGLAERSQDGSYRMTPTGRAVVNAMAAGDYQRAVDGVAHGTDAVRARQGRMTERVARQQTAAGKRATAQAARAARADAAARKRAEAAKKKPAKVASGGGSKKPAAQAVERPRRPTPAKRPTRGAIPSAGGLSSAPPPKPAKPAAAPKPEKVPAKQLAPALALAAQDLSDGKELSDDDTQALIRNGLARLVKGTLILTAAGMRATQKSFIVFKDASGAMRWVAQSSTAFQDRDKEIVSTKALSDDCAFADRTGSYGPLRWWHQVGLDLGDCDFNAMHGRILIESGTFRSPQIAQKVARAAGDLEISLGFLHLPNEPDADGVFHHIRRFERSLVPRGKASNRFTAFRVKERSMFDPTKVAALKTLGFSDDDITKLQSQAEATEKAADDQQTAYKADEPRTPGLHPGNASGELADDPSELPDLIINGITYKAFPPKAAEEVVEAVVEEDAIEDMPMEDEEEAAGGMTLSPEDLSAIGQAVGDALQAGIAQIMGALDLEKKVAGHVQGLLAPYTATKDAEAAQTKEQIQALTTKVAELNGDQPAVPYRASAAKDSVLSDATMLAAAKAVADPNGADPWADIKRGLGLAGA